MAHSIIRTALLAATGLALAATAVQAQPYQRPPVPYTQPVPWVPKAYPPMSQPWMRIDPSIPLWAAPVAPYQRPAPYRIQPRP